MVLPLSKQINGVVTAFEWNPAEDVFAAACSDKSLLTVQFNILVSCFMILCEFSRFLVKNRQF